ncbi:hypothetical protein [Streptomyces mirabilis]|uniref:hypothetical protein n=1 Tax=Streptomyces mirabilis TaxID=68239 RepID=UPI000AE9CEC7|nr:hypothetical protein [Streptomyces mirabilis]MCX4428662.1 hypothetical protein [Streptomyces mirabilis]
MISDCKAEQDIPHTLTCRALGVSESWFYKWRSQPVTAREVRRGQLADAIRQIFDESGGTYGSPKVWITEAVAMAINNRPRKVLGWRTPAEVFEEQLRSLQQPGVATTG